MKKFPQIVKELRTNKKLNQTEVASALGFTYFTYGKWEQGKAEPSLDSLYKLADYFEVSVDYLLGRTDELGIIQKENSLTKNESELLSLFKKLDTIKQNKVIGYCYALAN
ncbi:MAG: helix-turn-helix transcriptional regulator [Clostridia bacterium]|nr:helix-turn-helix transcriptional regulator [Clostridia bacterium]